MINYNLSFVGAGRVAGNLCRALYHSGHKINRIVSQSSGYGVSLADDCNAGWSQEPVFGDDCDIIIVAVPDDNLENVLSAIRCDKNTVVAHTAGSYGLDIFPHHIVRRGVFYPLQTFSKGREIDFRALPFLLEASGEETGKILKELVSSLYGDIHFIDLERRKKIHLAAVFVCNFVNHMLTTGKEIACEAGAGLELFEPLIKETISKALGLGPELSQTGPAVRNDRNTIEKHMNLLSLSPDIQKLYKDVTDSIIKYHKKSEDGKLQGGTDKG